MAALSYPFRSNSILDLIENQQGEFIPLPDQFSCAITELIQNILIYDELKRPSLDEIIAMPQLKPYVQKFKDSKQFKDFYRNDDIFDLSDLVREEEDWDFSEEKQIKLTN